MLRRIGTYGVCACGLVLWAQGCSAVLGIEDLGDLPPKGTAGAANGGNGNGGSSGDASLGGTSNGGRISGTGNVSGGGGTATGGGSNGGTGGSLGDGSVPDADSSAGAGGVGNGGAGGASGGAGGTTGGAGGTTGGAGGQNTGGAGGAGGGPTVNGKVIDFWGHPLENVIVTIAGVDKYTDAAGSFSFPNVTSTYDVSLVTSWVYYDNVTTGWVFQGLTRRDPTLQIDQGLADKSADTYGTMHGVTFPLVNQQIGFAWGSPDGNFFGSIDRVDPNLYYVYWYGPATSVGAAHTLKWTVDPVSLLPIAYKAHTVQSLSMVESPNPTYDITLTDDASITTGSISGAVTTSASTHENEVYVRFKDRAAIQVVNDTSLSTTNYSYKVPTNLQDGSITIAAADTTLDWYYNYYPIGVAHLDDVAPGAGVNLTTPTPQTLLTPIDGATLTPTTTFKWNGPAGVYVYTIVLDTLSQTRTVLNTMHIVTAAQQVSVPSFPSATYVIGPGIECGWFVEQHGSITTVDQAAGPTGFLDAFTHHTLEGPRRGGGTYTESDHRYFNTPP